MITRGWPRSRSPKASLCLISIWGRENPPAAPEAKAAAGAAGGGTGDGDSHELPRPSPTERGTSARRFLESGAEAEISILE